ncbi:two-component regulator propeller domain-containing protein [Robiginitalea sp. IMCC43444]|uniref:two-component regulator propeller domain-containing protein n=1 Tax=Robiginitalea sp. IMCC43444 TaxID=3459121 RepID=UPI00404289D8
MRNPEFHTIYCCFGFLLTVFCVAQLSGQNLGVNFKLITRVDEVKLGKINAITQDSYGYLWFSDQTNRSLLRYDGSTIEEFAFDPGKPDGIGGYYPKCLASEQNGVIWIGYNDSGLDCFDPKTQTFTHYVNDPNDPASLIDNTVSVVMVDRDGLVWVGTNKSVDRLYPKTGKFTHFQPFFTTMPTGQGTGPGLSLSYDMVTKGHGGDLKAEKVRGWGTAMIVLLPIQKMR